MILKSIDKYSKRLSCLNSDIKYSFLLNKDVRCVFVNSSRLSFQAITNFDLGPLESRILSQGYTASLLATISLKGEGSIRLVFEGTGPAGQLSAISDSNGNVKGYIQNTPFDIKEKKEFYGLGAVFGAGFLTVTKFQKDFKEPSVGTVMLQKGIISNDLASYYMESEQTPTLVGIWDSWEKTELESVCGIIIQALPGCDENFLSLLQEKILDMNLDIKKVLYKKNYGSIENGISDVFRDFNPKPLSTQPVQFNCACSKEGFIQYLSKLSNKSLEEYFKEDNKLECHCFNCGTDYQINKNEIWKS